MIVLGKIQADLEISKILEERGLGASKAATIHIAGVIRALCDPYVPFAQGTLKNTAQVVNDAAGVGILYNTPYAHYQYTGEVYGPNIPIRDAATGTIVGYYSRKDIKKHPTGREINYSGAPMRGKQWEKRMMADRGDDVKRELARYVGGTYK